MQRTGQEGQHWLMDTSSTFSSLAESIEQLMDQIDLLENYVEKEKDA